VAHTFAHDAVTGCINPEAEIEIVIRLTHNDAVHTLNKQWRSKDAPTNVLSFPMDAPDGDHPGGIMLGDIVLALGVCQAEAKDKKIALADHATHLIVHGFLHLLGFDHIEDDDASHMEAIERDVLRNLGLHNPYEDEI
jgi:probable rRNA maturation factor